MKKWRACCISATDCLQANSRVWNVIQAELFRTNKEARIKEVTGLIYISVRPNLLRPFNACGMVQRNSLALALSFILWTFPYFPGNSYSSIFCILSAAMCKRPDWATCQICSLHCEWHLQVQSQVSHRASGSLHYHNLYKPARYKDHSSPVP